LHDRGRIPFISPTSAGFKAHSFLLLPQDIFESFVFRTPSSPEDGVARNGGSAAHVAGSKGAVQAPATVEELPTLLVTREAKEHANVFHTLTGGLH
jgi:hypothetical protein